MHLIQLMLCLDNTIPVVTNLKEKIPYLYVMKCICHSAHLCASHACEKLPRAIENMVRDIYSFFRVTVLRD